VMRKKKIKRSGIRQEFWEKRSGSQIRLRKD
jgi:hypothetical protein